MDSTSSDLGHLAIVPPLPPIVRRPSSIPSPPPPSPIPSPTSPTPPTSLLLPLPRRRPRTTQLRLNLVARKLPRELMLLQDLGLLRLYPQESASAPTHEEEEREGTHIPLEHDFPPFNLFVRQPRLLPQRHPRFRASHDRSPLKESRIGDIRLLQHTRDSRIDGVRQWVLRTSSVRAREENERNARKSRRASQRHSSPPSHPPLLPPRHLARKCPAWDHQSPPRTLPSPRPRRKIRLRRER